MEQTLGATFQATPSALSGDAGEGRSWPTALTQGLREILGIPNFQCGPMAHAYQKIGEFSGDDGLALDKRAEDEQAFILHKLISFWFEPGDGWREPELERKNGVVGKSVSDGVDLGGRRINKKKK